MWLPCKDTCIQYTFIFGLLERSKKQYIFEINFREMKGAGREGERERETSRPRIRINKLQVIFYEFDIKAN